VILQLLIATPLAEAKYRKRQPRRYFDASVGQAVIPVRSEPVPCSNTASRDGTKVAAVKTCGKVSVVVRTRSVCIEVLRTFNENYRG